MKILELCEVEKQKNRLPYLLDSVIDLTKTEETDLVFLGINFISNTLIARLKIF